MAISIKGPTTPGTPLPSGVERNAAADAYARLQSKGGKRSARAAERVGELLDELVTDDDDLAEELSTARQMLDEISDDLPEGTGMAQAEAIAEKLKQKIEATRGERLRLAEKTRKAFDDVDE